MIGVYLITAITVIMIITAVIHNSRMDNKGRWVTFVIKKGKHYSINLNSIFDSRWKIRLAPKTLRFLAMFAEGTNMMGAEDDINKLYGMSFGFDPHWRSVRIGWRYQGNGSFRLFIYWYEGGKRKHKPLIDVELYEQIYFNIFHNNKDKVIVEVKYKDKVTVDWIPMSSSSTWLRFRLFPYFGGNTTAPCDMKILISNQ